MAAGRNITGHLENCSEKSERQFEIGVKSYEDQTTILHKILDSFEENFYPNQTRIKVKLTQII